MKTFIDFCVDTKKELPIYQTDENTKRAAIASWAYPQAASGRGYGYPDSYFMPHAADAMFKLKGDKATASK